MTDPRRIYHLNPVGTQPGCVIYWMQRDQRAIDNWALHYAQERALAIHQPLVVVFCLVPGFLGATIRQYDFMIKGLTVTSRNLGKFNIPFFLLYGLPHDVLPGFAEQMQAGLIVADFNPLRLPMAWKSKVAERISIPFHEVDAHNILPCRHISDKLEYAAFTLRKKVEQQLSEFLTEFPILVRHPDFAAFHEWIGPDWSEVMKSVRVDRDVPMVDWLLPGENNAADALINFIEERLHTYDTERNIPHRKGQSDLSPYLHFGHLSAQRVAIEIMKSEGNPASKTAFLEEMIVRRELADNFCLHNPDYDNFNGFQPWARTTLNKHRDDPREYQYTVAQFEHALTHDDLWNAAQREMVVTGKMHGYMRMYWAKKILEWTRSPEEAMAIAIYLNDKYELDGRDPNGYAGIAWAIGGTHDRPWGERSIFGMIRYMNYQGCKRKFDINKYIQNNPKL
jgi:deoxyribodipyrimidine photo-lyase